MLAQACPWMGLPPVELPGEEQSLQGFLQLGIDSLELVRLKNRLGPSYAAILRVLGQNSTNLDGWELGFFNVVKGCKRV